MRFSIHTIYNQLFKLWRRKRLNLFVRLLPPRPNQHLIDIGGVPSFWTQYPGTLERIDTLNVYQITWDRNASPHHNIKTLVGDGCALQFADKSYDITFS